MAQPEEKREPGFWKFTAYVTDKKTGERRYARDEGKRCFCIWIRLRK